MGLVNNENDDGSIAGNEDKLDVFVDDFSGLGIKLLRVAKVTK